MGLDRLDRDPHCKDGQISFDTAEPYLGLGISKPRPAAREVGKKVSLALCSAVGEYRGLIAGISFSDTDQRPSRLAARGGVGAVMGGKKVKAIVAELNRMPQLHDRKKVISAVKTYNAKLNEDEIAQNQKTYGTALMGMSRTISAGYPYVISATAGSPPARRNHEDGGADIREMQLERGGQTAHACMPGCTIECSNVYVDKDGTEITSPVEYETLGLMGTNCGLTEPDERARGQ
ncbi:MAG: hypothetical protein CM1200mP20_06740 [Pseudomonadota bacterium]|nr:MAG: hypothetical protein CM1200mP20_06740 [Pseudomonadota bacterium]